MNVVKGDYGMYNVMGFDVLRQKSKNMSTIRWKTRIFFPIFAIPLCQSVGERTFVNEMVLLKLSSNIEFSQNLYSVKM